MCGRVVVVRKTCGRVVVRAEEDVWEGDGE